MIQYENDFRCKQFRQEHLNVPKWAKGERMEMIVPEKELWKWGRFDTPFKSRHRVSSCKSKVMKSGIT